MFQTFFIKIYFLFLFIFAFLFIWQRYFEVEIFYIFISLYWVLLIPLKWFFTNNFKKLLSNPSLKNIIFNPWIYLFLLSLFFWYILAFNTILWLIITFYLFSLAFEIENKNIFFLWIIYFIWFFIFYFLNPDSYIYSSYLIFSLYSIIFWIFYTLIWKILFPFHQYIWKIIFMCFILLFTISFYFPILFPYLPIFICILLIFWNNSGEKNIYNSNFKIDIIISSFFFICFIPIINDFLNFDEKNIFLIFSSIWFFISYIWYNLIIKKALS